MRKGTELEEFVEYVYSILLKNEHIRNMIIKKNHIEIGRSGANHEFDVYYEIRIANILHKVAIECKQHNRAITKSMVQEFKGKLDDCNNIVGFMVTSLGYQKGAKEYAEHYGIKTLTTEELPKINQTLALAVGWMIPDESSHGDPFWTIMVTEDGKNTGTYVPLCENVITLFISKKAAEKVVEYEGFSNVKVYGVTREHLRGICAIAEHSGYKIGICPIIGINEKSDLLIIPYSFSTIIEEYLE